MATPRHFSYSSLDKFLTCPRRYYFQEVLRQYKEEQGPAQIYGEEVHKHFEDYVRDGTPLPNHLQMHYGYLNTLRQRPGKVDVEIKCCLNIRCQVVDYDAPDKWYRGRIDYYNFDDTYKGNIEAKIVDYKTGKVKPKPLQLKLNMLWAFAMGADFVDAEFYWTQTQTTTKIKFPRSHAPQILKNLKPDLAQYAEAWHKDIWQPRPSGLCRGWCPVVECEFHGRGR